jgi:hypothetical protein
MPAVPFLADIDNPPPSRLPGLIFGAIVALPIVGAIAFFFIPMGVGAIVGGASDLDERLRANDAYMRELCGVAYSQDRDAQLCECVWTMDFPALDCGSRFDVWAVEQQQPACAADFDAHLGYCTCVEAVRGKIEAASEDERHAEAAAYERCELLDDAIPLPSIESLTPAPVEAQ